MNTFQSIFLGIVEGLTEFLPISSTFHLIASSSLLKIAQTDFVKLFEVFIQGGAILAVLFLYGREFLTNRELFKKVIISFIPTAIIGFLLYKMIKEVFFESTYLMLTVFVTMGVVFLAVEWLIKKGRIRLDRSLKTLSTRDAVIIGLIQSLAVVPGVSRAGAVIVGLMIMRYRRDESAKYSFLLSVPTILAASAYDLFKMRSVLFENSSNSLYLFIGSAAAFVSAYFVMRWFIRFLKTRTLTIFAFYRFIVAIILFLALYR